MPGARASMMLRTAQPACCDCSPTTAQHQPSNNTSHLGIPRLLRNRPSPYWPTTWTWTAHPFVLRIERTTPFGARASQGCRHQDPKHTTTRSQPGRRRRETQRAGILTPLFRPLRSSSGERRPIEQSHPQDKHHSCPSCSGGGQRATTPRRGIALRHPAATITPPPSRTRRLSISKKSLVPAHHHPFTRDTA